MQISLPILSLCLGLLVLTACGGGLKTSESPSATPAEPEPDYCSSITSYTGTTVQIQGLAQFEFRAVEIYSYGATSAVRLNGNPQIDTIKFAEVALTNAAGSIIQCGTTLADGTFSLTIPKTAGTYFLTVKSRSFNSSAKASILKDITSNSPYEITTKFSLISSDSSPKNIGTVTASARQTTSASLEGAAFNILNNIYIANEYIRSAISDPSFVAPKVKVYWKVGFTPSSYFGGSSAVSFYQSGTTELYILGGMNGDVKSSDTDHFDNSVILHEYGHFLEDIYAISDSPGGSHNGQRLIDPRLAWSEGFANFFAAEVLNWTNTGPTWNYYADTKGFQNDTVEGGSSIPGFYLDLSESPTTATFDAVTTAGEGVFREVSVARTLFKAIHTSNISFSKIWTNFTSSFGSNSVYFRNSGTFFKNLYNNILNSTEKTALDALVTNEMQSRAPANYGIAASLVTKDSCAAQQMSPVVESSLNDYLYLMKSNQYFIFDNTNRNTKQLQLFMINNGSPAIDLDLILYKYHYTFSSEDTLSQNTTVQMKSTSSQLSAVSNQVIETLDVSGIPAGVYLLNVKAKTYGKTAAQINQAASSYIQYRIYSKNTSNVVGELCP